MDTQDALHDAHVARLETNRLEHVLVQWLDEPGDTRTDEFHAAWETHEQIDQCKADIRRWERLERNAPTRSEAIIAEHKLAGLRAELTGLLGQLAGATQEQPQVTDGQPGDGQIQGRPSNIAPKPLTR